ncbi:hypothetical protein K435DRAFT_641073 [Dendrothele bispora CBS 962.96]|uniref:Uncharacterized protein n=1 Tax=Dendrothele bispora (strain CBS 962.96) TaxID=1314807 RepID=A0A4S8MYQ0_DENBC|nr:hypothetical protein K435DRAFT_641073 [Dendrothele bispora CBS 962.96]
MLNERARTTSNGTMDTSRLIDNDNPFSLRPPSRSSRFDPKAAAHARTMSNASLGSRMLLDNDGASVMTGLGERQMTTQNRYSTTMDLLRPKILVMPSPLQTAGRPAKNSPEPTNIDGFELSSDGTPLPPGARSSRRSSSYGLTPPPIASNSFTPNPRSNLSLSQLTFRNYLSAGNHGGSGYNDLDSEIPRAAEEGEQMFLEAPQEEEVASIPDIDEPTPLSRPAGKLYGKSLIDDLESRKLQMRSKQRVFRGDDRPSMMARTQSNTSTLIDPASLRTRPASQFLGPSGGLERRNSANAKPLLNFDDEGKSPVTPRGPPNRSVFGVDTLWESEMARLRKMEAEEAEERERQKAQELKPEKDKKRKKKKGGDTLEVITPEVSPMQSVSAPEEPEEPPLSAGPPVLPAIPQAIRGPPPATADDDSGSEESDSDKPKKKVQPATNAWHSDSEDEADEGPRRTTGIGLRYPRKDSVSKVQRDGDDSEEDVPLSATVSRAVQRATRLAAESDSDEDKPLNALSNKAKLNIPPINFDSLSLSKGGGDEEDEDNQPLGIRASRLMPSPRSADEDDDERPLGLHPEHQRRTQYQMMAQHQQMMMQAQMHNSMFFNPSMMGSGFFGPPMAPPMVMPMVPQAPMPIPSPPPVQDAAKLNRVDRWRHNVAIEGE